MRASLLSFFAAVTVGVVFGACNCGTPPGGEADGGVDSGDPNVAEVVADSGPGSVCLADNVACDVAGGNVCCSGVCQNNKCSVPAFCKGPTAACAGNAECCSNRCLNGTCSNVTCLDVGQTCQIHGDCCTSTCGSDGKCAQITTPPSYSGPTCKVLGQACTAKTDCCSTNCQGGVCVRAYSCQPEGDVCTTGTDCCTTLCAVSDGGTGGRCFVSQTNAICDQGGMPCTGGTNCCSRICVDPGTGATICQPAGGCHLPGDACGVAQDCCGGGTNPNSLTKCEGSRCDNGKSCSPTGNICGANVLLDGGKINAEQNCCDGNQAVCKLDSSGIPRCFGGGNISGCPNGYTGATNCCIAAGDLCQFKDQCCNGLPCVPGSDGKLHCTAQTCKAVGTSCTQGSTNECCTGTQCLAAGELGGYVCQVPASGGPGSGTPDGGACLANDATCSTASQCCSQICTGNKCVPPAACQPQGAVCTASGDCCTGLGCAVTGSGGTCQPSACASGGQACSSANPCCSGLACLDDALNNCTNPPCTCTFLIQ
jgi:hypothetical protein